MTSKKLLKRRFPLAYYRLSRWRRQSRINGYPVREVRHIYGGFPLTIHLADQQGEDWYDMDWEELPEISLLKRHRLKSGARVFDIGAHQGVVALMLAGLVGEKGSVIAVEAEPHHARIAERNRVLNGVNHVRILQTAVALYTKWRPTLLPAGAGAPQTAAP